MSPKKGEGKICPHCKGPANFIEEFKKYYCYSCNKYVEPIEGKPEEKPTDTALEDKPDDSLSAQVPMDFDEMVRLKETPMICPKCEKEANFIMQYGQYYCYGCEEYLPPPKREEPEPVVEEEVVQEPKEVVEQVEETLVEEKEKDLDEYISELDTLSHEPGPEDDVGGRKRRDFSDYRYRSRMLKATILPIIFGLISLSMLNSNVMQFPKYYEYKITIILAGFILGFGVLTGITTANLLRAKKKGINGCQLNKMMGFVGFLPFIIVLLVLTLFDSLSTAWQFAVGFFFAPIFSILIIAAVEAGSKGKFYVRELVDDPSYGRKLVFVR
jgi:hypothetical protein